MNDEPVEAGTVTGATGDFYASYKRELFQLLSFIEARGAESQSTDKLPESDRHFLTTNLRVVEEKGKDLSRLLSNIINESDPSFYEESTIEVVWSLLEAAFATGQYVGMTSLHFQKYERRERTTVPRKEKRDQDDSRKERRLKALKEYIQVHPVVAYTKFILSHLDAINATLGDDDKAKKSTWIGLMQELGYGPQKKSKTGSVVGKVQD